MFTQDSARERPLLYQTILDGEKDIHKTELLHGGWNHSLIVPRRILSSFLLWVFFQINDLLHIIPIFLSLIIKISFLCFICNLKHWFLMKSRKRLCNCNCNLLLLIRYLQRETVKILWIVICFCYIFLKFMTVNYNILIIFISSISSSSIVSIAASCDLLHYQYHFNFISIAFPPHMHAPSSAMLSVLLDLNYYHLATSSVATSCWFSYAILHDWTFVVDSKKIVLKVLFIICQICNAQSICKSLSSK